MYFHFSVIRPCLIFSKINTQTAMKLKKNCLWNLSIFIIQNGLEKIWKVDFLAKIFMLVSLRKESNYHDNRIASSNINSFPQIFKISKNKDRGAWHHNRPFNSTIRLGSGVTRRVIVIGIRWSLNQVQVPWPRFSSTLWSRNLMFRIPQIILTDQCPLMNLDFGKNEVCIC